MKIKTISKFFALTFFAMMAVSCHHKDDVGPVKPPVVEKAPNKLMGYVTDVNGKPISGATVTLNSSVETTDNKGYYEFTNILAGDYTVSAVADGMMEAAETITVSSTDYTQYYFWNACLFKDLSMTFNYTVSDGAEATIVTEASDDNEMAETEINVKADPGVISEDSQLLIIPIYDENSALLTRSLANGDHMMVGCILSCTNPKATISRPINLRFNVSGQNTDSYHAKIFRNNQWINAESYVDGNQIVIPVTEFGGAGLFANLNFREEKSKENLSFNRSYWDNTGGTGMMKVDEIMYNYKVGTEFNKTPSTKLEALLKEYLTIKLSALTMSNETGTYPVNVELPFGTFLRIIGDQEMTITTVNCQNESMAATTYGTCSFHVTTGTQDHQGGASE